jgi:hypothetical protein
MITRDVIRDFMVVAFVRCQRLPKDRIESIENGNKRRVIVKSMDRLPWSSSAFALWDPNLLPDNMKV